MALRRFARYLMAGVVPLMWGTGVLYDYAPVQVFITAPLSGGEFIQQLDCYPMQPGDDPVVYVFFNAPGGTAQYSCRVESEFIVKPITPPRPTNPRA